MTEALAFECIEFSGVTLMERPNPRLYVVRRKAGSNLQFKATLNRQPAPREDEDDFGYRAYPGCSMEYIIDGDEYKSFWSVNQWAPLQCPPGECEAHISVIMKRPVVPGDSSFGVTVRIITEELTEEQKVACTHPSTRSCEGEVWGGASGSCSVEIITSCAVCGVTLSKSFDYRN